MDCIYNNINSDRWQVLIVYSFYDKITTTKNKQTGCTPGSENLNSNVVHFYNDTMIQMSSIGIVVVVVLV